MIPLAIAGALGLGAASLGTGLYNTYMQDKVAGENLEFQRENLAYQKDLQAQVFSREDNAIQRRVKDLQAAGLSPTLAAGSAAGAGSIVSTQAPQRQYVPRYDASQAGKVALDMIQMQQSVEQSKKQTELIDKQVARADADARIAQHDADYIEKSGFTSGQLNNQWGMIGSLLERVFGERMHNVPGKVVQSVKSAVQPKIDAMQKQIDADPNAQYYKFKK